jgi:hypothetical protein
VKEKLGLTRLWLQKSFGPWTTYGGGAALNSAPGQRDYPFGGWLVQRDFGKHLTLGREFFAQGRDTDNDKDLPRSISAVPATSTNISVCCSARGTVLPVTNTHSGVPGFTMTRP